MTRQQQVAKSQQATARGRQGFASPGNAAMRMSSFVIQEAIVPSLSGTTREGVIRELVAGLGRAGYFDEAEADDVVQAVLRREQLGSTGIGRGIAIPHAKHDGVDGLIGTLGVSHQGVPFDSIDGEPVSIFVLLISPQDRPGDHLRALENVVRTLRDDALVEKLRSARTAEEIWKLLDGSRNPWGGDGQPEQ
jgi:PTS system fructose-specific IIA component/PTS system nitrogen regulatory IIA component